MSNPMTVHPVDNQGAEQVHTTAPTSKDPATAGAIASTNSDFNSSTRVNSVDDLRKKAPKVYQAMLEGIAWHICGEMKRSQDRLKQMMRESYNH